MEYIQNMKNSSIYPNFSELFWLDWYIDYSWKFIQLSSLKKWSDESRVNDILRKIERENGNFAFLQNRVRERAAIVFLGIFSSPFETVVPTEIVNDILYWIDAIGKTNWSYFALDFTENPNVISEKFIRTESGSKKLRDPDGNIVRLPFRVVYIHQARIRWLLEVGESYLLQHKSTWHKLPKISEFMSAMKILIPPFQAWEFCIYENPPPIR